MSLYGLVWSAGSVCADKNQSADIDQIYVFYKLLKNYYYSHLLTLI